MFIQGYVPTITMPRRVTHQSATLIDNIFTNKPTHEDLTGIIITDISDHFAMFHIGNFNKRPPINIPKYTTTRTLKHENILALKTQLKSTDVSPIFSSHCPTEANK